jgi:hypothetical protein
MRRAVPRAVVWPLPPRLSGDAVVGDENARCGHKNEVGEDVKPQPGCSAPVSEEALRVQVRVPVAASSALTMPVAPWV